MSLDWKWIVLGILIMFGLSFVAGLIAAAMLGDQLAAVAEGGELVISQGQLIAIAVLNFLAFLIGGYIVGVRSSGRTILEPGLSAAIAVAIGLLVSGNLTAAGLLTGALTPFVAGLIGGWLGERRQGRA